MLRSLKKGLVLVITLVSSFILFSHSVLAAVPFTGEFTATDNCEALVSIRKGTNPDNLKLKQGETYQVVAQNSDRPSHYLVEIDDAQPNER
jgi:ribonuclease T2